MKLDSNYRPEYLDLIRQITKKEENASVNNFIDSFDILTMLLKYQNKILINNIGNYMNLEEEELNDLTKDFLKVSYYTPLVVNNDAEEKSQVYIIRKNIKKYKKYKKTKNQIYIIIKNIKKRKIKKKNQVYIIKKIKKFKKLTNIKNHS